MAGTITVKGTGRMNLSPDTIVIDMTVRSEDPDYEKAVKKAHLSLGAIGERLAEAGFGKDDLRTSDFSADTVYESENDERGIWHNVFKGYSCVYRMKLEFPFDSARLSDALKALSASGTQPEMDIAFTVKDRRSLEKELIRRACLDAEEKAETIAEVSGRKITGLASAVYGDDMPSFRSGTRFTVKMGALDRGYEDAAVMPEDIEETEEVTCVYEME